MALGQILLVFLVTFANGEERLSDGAFSPKDHGEDGHHQLFDHEAILGSKELAKEFEHLSPDIAKERLLIIVKKMDKNQNGFVEKDELTSWVFRSFYLLTEEEAKERFEESDENKDGRVTWVEYISDMYGVSDDNLQTHEFPEDEKMMKEDRELFQAADSNSDGFLDPQEFQAFSHPEDFPHTIEILYKRTLEEKDIDKDGLISFQEFIHPDGKEKDREWMIAEKDKFQNDFDKNQDGFLDKAETILWLQPNNWESATIEAQHLMDNADDDKDNKLSYQEVLDNHDVFVGSEVTDFGNHLHTPHKYYDEL